MTKTFSRGFPKELMAAAICRCCDSTALSGMLPGIVGSANKPATRTWRTFAAKPNVAYPSLVVNYTAILGTRGNKYNTLMRATALLQVKLYNSKTAEGLHGNCQY